MQIRLHGTPAECHEAARRLAEVFAVVATRGPYPDRQGALVRVYLDIRLPTIPATPAAGAASPKPAPAARHSRPRPRRRPQRPSPSTGGTP